MEIKNFEELIKPILKKGEKYISYNYEKLLSIGENYGSVMLKVEVKILNDRGKEETIHYVGKACPPSDFLWDVFNTKVTFKKEVAVYAKIIPALNEYGKEKGIDNLIEFIADYITSRVSLDPKSDVVDEDCLLLLENIKVKGYDVGDRFTGFDLETAKLLLRDLATLHAVPIAFKFDKSDEFSKIRPYLDRDLNMPDSSNVIDTMIEKMQNAVKSSPNCIPYLSKIDEHMHNLTYNHKNPLKINELYATIVHNDYWVNNTMVKFQNGKPIRNKMVDFQIISYDSLAHDVIFFLYSSVELSVLEKHADELMKFYYDQFLETLIKLKYDVSKYSYEDMLKEFGRFANYDQFGHILLMLTPILTLRGKAKELSDLDLDDMIMEEDSLHENYFKRMQYVVSDFGKRGWI